MGTLKVDLLDLVMTGEAARICGVDRRTFMAWAKKFGVLPVGAPQGRAIFERKDIERIRRRINDAKQHKD